MQTLQRPRGQGDLMQMRGVSLNPQRRYDFQGLSLQKESRVFSLEHHQAVGKRSHLPAIPHKDAAPYLPFTRNPNKLNHKILNQIMSKALSNFVDILKGQSDMDKTANEDAGRRLHTAETNKRWEMGGAKPASEDPHNEFIDWSEDRLRLNINKPNKGPKLVQAGMFKRREYIPQRRIFSEQTTRKAMQMRKKEEPDLKQMEVTFYRGGCK